MVRDSQNENWHQLVLAMEQSPRLAAKFKPNNTGYCCKNRAKINPSFKEQNVVTQDKYAKEALAAAAANEWKTDTKVQILQSIFGSYCLL